MTARSAADVSRQIPAVVRAPPSWNKVIPFHNILFCTHLCIDRLEIQSMLSGRHKLKLCMLLISRIPHLSPPRPPRCAIWTEGMALNESLWVGLKLHFPNVWHFNTFRPHKSIHFPHSEMKSDHQKQSDHWDSVTSRSHGGEKINSHATYSPLMTVRLG